MSEIKEEIKFKPGISIDIGTAFLVTTRQKEDGTFVNKFHRNCLFPLDINDESADLLEKSSYAFIKTNDKYFVLGEHAINLINAIGKGSVIRPMKEGILNPSLKEAGDLLFYIIKSIVGDPIIPNENLRFSIPANPVDKDMDNLFHQKVLESMFTKLGFSAKSVNESMCIVYDCNPILKSEDGDVPLSGIAMSFGGGMVNVGLAYRGMGLVEFSCTKSGDNIDEQVEKVTGVQKSKIVKIKEKKLDLDKIDTNDRVQTALSIFYDETIDRVVHQACERFREKSSEIDGEIEIVIAGGTSLVPGFINRLEKSIKKANMPFKIYRIRHSQTPFFSVANGACIRARADYEKSLKNKK